LHLGNILAGDAHLHRADFDIEVIVANFFLTMAARPIDLSLTVSPSETCLTRLAGRSVAAIGAGRVRD